MLEIGSLLLQKCLARLVHTLAAVSLASGAPTAGQSAEACKPLTTVGDVTVWQHDGRHEAIVFRAGMTIDVDGAPTAYHPNDRGALNRLAHAGRAGRWWALVTKNGEPVVQGPGDPAPGYYVSMTSLESSSFAPTDPRRYVDASAIPYIALPASVTKAGRIRLGDLAVVINQANGKLAYAIYADQGPKDRIGEGSLYLANRLRNTPLPDSIGIRKSLVDDLVYVVFPGSGNGKPRTREQIAAAGAKLFDRLGGLSTVEACLP